MGVESRDDFFGKVLSTGSFESLLTDPDTMNAAIASFKEKLWSENFDFLAPSWPHITALVSALAKDAGVNLKPPFDEMKHGRGVKRIVLAIGVGEPNLTRMSGLRDEGFIVNGALILFDYGLITQREMEDRGFFLHAVFSREQVQQFVNKTHVYV